MKRDADEADNMADLLAAIPSAASSLASEKPILPEDHSGISTHSTSEKSRQLAREFPTQNIRPWQVLTSGAVLLTCAIAVMLFFSQAFDLGDDVIGFLLNEVSGARYLRASAFTALGNTAAAPRAACACRPPTYFPPADHAARLSASPASPATVALYGGAFVGILLLYLLDFSYWKGPLGALLRRLCTGALLVCLAMAGLLSIDDWPMTPLVIAMLLLPFAALFLRTTIFRNNGSSDVSCVIGINFVTAALIVLVIWLLWLFGAWTTVHNHWFERREHFAALARCQHHEWDSAGVTTVADGTTICLAAFLLWASPLMLFGICIFLGLFLILLSRTMTHSDASSTRYAIKFLVFVVGITVFGMYSAITVSPAGIQLTRVAFACYAVALLATIIIAGTTIGWSTLRAKLEENPYIKRAHNLGSPWIDMVHGLFIVASPLYFMFLVLSFANQLVRKAACSCGVCKTLEGEERTQRLTSIAVKLNRYLGRWQWTQALFWTQMFCLFVWGYRYFTILCNIVFNRLIVELSRFHWLATSGLFICIGLVMFLLPVVPGPVVYLTSGVLVVPTMEAQLGGRPAEPPCPDIGGNATNVTGVAGPVYSEVPFWIGCAWANLISYMLKLIAHILQQKAIGETLGGYVSIRAMVSPNSQLMKAFNYLLRQRGVTMAKVSIMCGGPDWPTSVICGFLKLPMCNLLLGLTPMFLMTVPTTLTGAFLNPPTPAYNNVSNFLFLIVLFVQLVFGVGVMHFSNQALHLHAEEIKAIPDDLEVKALEEREAAMAELKLKVTRFQDLPMSMKFVVGGSTVTLVLTTYLLALFPSRLYQPFQLKSCPRLLGVAPYNFIPSMTFLGFLALVGLVLSIFGMYFFSKWAERQVRIAASRACVGAVYRLHASRRLSRRLASGAPCVQVAAKHKAATAADGKKDIELAGTGAATAPAVLAPAPSSSLLDDAASMAVLNPAVSALLGPAVANPRASAQSAPAPASDDLSREITSNRQHTGTVVRHGDAKKNAPAAAVLKPARTTPSVAYTL